MKLYKPINNNIVSAFDDDNQEIIVIGRGIGYKAKRGAIIDKDSVQKMRFVKVVFQKVYFMYLFSSIQFHLAQNNGWERAVMI